MSAQTLPQLTSDSVYLTDGGLETTLVFLDGMELPDFAAFPLLGSDDGKSHLDRYFRPYLDLAERTGAGLRARHGHLAGQPRLGRAARLRRRHSRGGEPTRSGVRRLAGPRTARCRS